MNLDFVHPRVIRAVNNLQADDADTAGVNDDPQQQQRRNVNLMDMPLDEPEALFVVGFLHGLLSSQQQQQQQKMTTGLILGPQFTEGDVYSDRVVAMFCSFLQNTTSSLTSLHLSGFPTAQLRRLLEALHTNASVKELKISHVILHEQTEDDPDGAAAAIRIIDFLRHKNDFTALSFDNCYDFEMAQIVPFLREGPGHLQTLEFEECDIGDPGTLLLVDALMKNKHKYQSLKKLGLRSNEITANGLRELSKLDSSVLPSLEWLDLTENRTLLDDTESTKLFAQKILLPPGTTLKKLCLRFCAKEAAGYITIIQSLESNKTLQVLDIITSPSMEHFQTIGDHLILSLPKMTGVQQLCVASEVLNPLLDDESALTAFRKNASLLDVAYGTPRLTTPLSNYARLTPILERNKQLVKLDALLGTPTTSTTTTAVIPNTTTTSISSTIPPPPCGLWAPLLAKVGQGGEGCSPVFKVFLNRLATWVVAETSEHSNNCCLKKMTTKRSREQDLCATTQMDNKKRKQG